MNADARGLAGRTLERFLPSAWVKVALVVILLLALALRLYRLDGQSLWADEGNSAALAGRPFAGIAADAAQDIHPPLYYFCLRAWTRLFGTGESGLRSLSVAWSLLLIIAVYALGRRAGGPLHGSVAALLAAASPFGVYYAQEARMYMMAAALAALAGYAAWRIAEDQASRLAAALQWAALYVIAAAAGLYTHYFFPVVLLAFNLAYLLFWLGRRRWLALGRWLALQLLVLLLYLPWLGVALSRLGAWPAGRLDYPDAGSWLRDAWRTFCLGPAGQEGAAWVFLAIVAVGLVVAGRREAWRRGLFYALAWAAPLALMGAGDLHQAARLKFLLLGSPFLALTLAEGVWSGVRANLTGWRRALAYLWAGLSLSALLAGSGLALARYYGEARFARDDYRGMAATISALERAGDAVLLNAPGQWDVFSYYYRGALPIYRLPASRPPQRAALEAQLAEIVGQHGRLFVLYWAEDEADPLSLMETWLDLRAFKGFEAWVGNVRFVIYATPAYRSGTMRGSQPALTFGDGIRLEGVERSDAPLTAGDLLPVKFVWRAAAQTAEPLKLFVQALDAGNHIVGQRDVEVKLADRAETRQAVWIEPGTPPGVYRLIAGLYGAQSGQRLRVIETGLDFVELGQILVERPARALPATVLAPTHRVGRACGPLRFIGYDRHALGAPRDSNEPLAAGAPLHLTLYWQATDAPAANWAYRLWLAGRVWVDWSPIGGDYPTSQWGAGELLRQQLDAFLPSDLPAGRRPLRLEIRPPGQEKAQGVFSLGTVTVR